MERLHDMLVDYNSRFIPKEYRRSWSNQFCEPKFPCYWEKVFEELQFVDKSKRIIEVGCGQGDVTSILCYLGFMHIKAYEMDNIMCSIAIDKLNRLFGKSGIVTYGKYPQGQESADVLILVNCAYADGCETKVDYMKKIISFFEYAGMPELFLLEVVDPEYNIPDENFPYCLRLNSSDIEVMFPAATIHSYETYHYPQNKRTKRLYIIKHSK